MTFDTTASGVRDATVKLVSPPGGMQTLRSSCQGSPVPRPSLEITVMVRVRHLPESATLQVEPSRPVKVPSGKGMSTKVGALRATELNSVLPSGISRYSDPDIELVPEAATRGNFTSNDAGPADGEHRRFTVMELAPPMLKPPGIGLIVAIVASPMDEDARRPDAGARDFFLGFFFDSRFVGPFKIPSRS